jgi:hypothetical protein
MCDNGINAALGIITGKSSVSIGTQRLRLFKAKTGTIDKTSTIGQLTENDFAGYANITLVGASWASPTLAANVATSLYGGTTTFTRSSTGTAQSILGWYITDSGNTLLHAVCLLGTAVVLTNSGDNYTPQITLSEQSLN